MCLYVQQFSDVDDQILGEILDHPHTKEVAKNLVETEVYILLNVASCNYAYLCVGTCFLVSTVTCALFDCLSHTLTSLSCSIQFIRVVQCTSI